VINGNQQHVVLHRTGCDNITSFFEMRAIQTVGVVMGREWSHSEAVVLKICSLSLSAAIMRWKSGKPAFAVEVYFSNVFNVGSCREPEINCHMGHYVQTMISDKPGV
jgi:hypothetical protein